MKTIRFSWKEYEKYVLCDDLEKVNPLNPFFIPIPNHESVFVMVKDVILTPYAKTNSNIKIPEGVNELAKEKEYVIFSEERIIGCEDEIYTLFYHQPRFEVYSWLIIEDIGGKYFWYKKYGSSLDLRNWLIGYFVKSKEIICNMKAITDIGVELYKKVYGEAFGARLYYSVDLNALMEECEENDFAPFHTYKVARLLKAVAA